MNNTCKGYKILISVISFVSSFVAASFVMGYVAETGLGLGWQFLFRFAATMSVVSNIWLIIALFRRKK